MAKRKAISKKIRFEVFKRDSFTCQYCGAKAPDVLLHADHINPVSKGGANSILNLVTACESCNGGKSNVLLSENQALDKARNQAEVLQARREQIGMMAEWHASLADLGALEQQTLADHWKKLTGWMLSPTGLAEITKLKKQFGVSQVLTAMTISHTSYLAGKTVTQELIEHAFKKIGGICFNAKREAEDPLYGVSRRLKNYIMKAGTMQSWQGEELTALMTVALERGKTEAELRALWWKETGYWNFKNALQAILGDSDK